MLKMLCSIVAVVLPSVSMLAQSLHISGRVVDNETMTGVGFSYVSVPEQSLWATTDADGYFVIKNVSCGELVVAVQCLGYDRLSHKMTVDCDVTDLVLYIRPMSLKLEDVTVVAQRKESECSTSYSISRIALEHQQILNLSSVSSLLPGGRTMNDDLTSDKRVQLRSESAEKGNAAFGTAIMVDGVRMDNNAIMSETMPASTRSVATSDIESVDVVTGIPSVEYGDLSNGVVKVNMRKGKTPWTVDGKISQNTTQCAVSKGFELEGTRGVINVSYEYARSFAQLASPYTAYRRNILSIRYSNTVCRDRTPVSLTLGVTGNVGGYNARQDPDNTLDSYSKADDNVVRAYCEGNILLNKSWITNLSVTANATWQNRRTENYTNASSSSAQPYIHITEQGYHVAGVSPQDDIVLGPTGYWYVREFHDQKPVSVSAALKGSWSMRIDDNMLSKLLVGAELASTGNNGMGRHFTDIAVAPTWRPYPYKDLPWMNNGAFYVEEKITRSFGDGHVGVLNVGLRDDMTYIPHSSYDMRVSLSPRFSGRYEWHGSGLVSNVSVHAGWGRSVKLPSFQVLYPQESYHDILTFTPGSTADNRAYYAYYTHVSKSLYNDGLLYQYTNQTDIGIETKISRIKFTFSLFHNVTHNPYQRMAVYTPFEYRYTSQSSLEGIDIPVDERTYNVDRQTGIVTVSGDGREVELASTMRRTFTGNTKYINGSSVSRSGIEWVLDAPLYRWLSIRADGIYYRYRAVDDRYCCGAPSGVGDYASDGQEPVVGYYLGSSVTSAGSTSVPTVSNGSESRRLNNNLSLTVHVPRARIVVVLKAESTLFSYSRQLSVGHGAARGIVLEHSGDVAGVGYNGEEDCYVALYPEYYATWSNPDVLVPFASALAAARDNDNELYQQLLRLIVRSNTSYYFNANRLSPYCSFNLLVSKEIGDHVSMSFYANNFLNTMRSVHSSQTGLDTSLFDSGYVAKYYYGLSLKVKI